MTPQRVKQLRNTALIGAVFLLMLDRLAKQSALKIWSQDPVSVIPNLLTLSFTKNFYVAFSFNTLIDPLVFIIPIIFLLIGSALLLWRQRRADVLPLLFIIAGAASNLYDRVVFGYVIDYFDFKFFTVFNLADAMISVGVVWLIILSYQQKQSAILTGKD